MREPIFIPRKEDETASKNLAPKLGKKASKPLIKIALDKKEAYRMIRRIKEESRDHWISLIQLKTRIEKLTETAREELVKAKELDRIVESLLQKQEKAESAKDIVAAKTTVAPLSEYKNQPEVKKRDFDRELEKLFIIQKLVAEPKPQKPEMRELSLPAPEINGQKKILIVDDDITIVKIITHFLKKENYRVTSALSGVEGLKNALKEAPDLILLDIMMPDLDGFQFLSILRKDKEAFSTPVLILSSLSDETDVLKGLRIGATDYVTKPFSPQVLLAKIKKNINLEK